MTNEQLAVFIRLWKNRLAREVELLRLELPEETPRQVYTNFLTKQESTGDYICLAGLQALLNELDQSEQALKEQRKD